MFGGSKKYPVLRTCPWDHLKHKVGNFKLEIERQCVKSNLIDQHLRKGEKKWKGQTDIALDLWQRKDK